jgi:hypothetical protein
MADQIARAGTLFSLSIPATDTDLPEQSLVFSLEPGAPVGMEIDPAAGLLSWTPTAADMFTTNAVMVRVTDSGSPPQTSTRALGIVVLPKVEARITRNGSTVFIQAETLIGRTYRVEFKDNLAAPSWMPLGNPALATSETVTFADSLSGHLQRFYRVVQLD